MLKFVLGNFSKNLNSLLKTRNFTSYYQIQLIDKHIGSKNLIQNDSLFINKNKIIKKEKIYEQFENYHTYLKRITKKNN